MPDFPETRFPQPRRSIQICHSETNIHTDRCQSQNASQKLENAQKKSLSFPLPEICRRISNWTFHSLLLFCAFSIQDNNKNTTAVKTRSSVNRITRIRNHTFNPERKRLDSSRSISPAGSGTGNSHLPLLPRSGLQITHQLQHLKQGEGRAGKRIQSLGRR